TGHTGPNNSTINNMRVYNGVAETIPSNQAFSFPTTAVHNGTTITKPDDHSINLEGDATYLVTYLVHLENTNNEAIGITVNGAVIPGSRVANTVTGTGVIELGASIIIQTPAGANTLQLRNLTATDTKTSPYMSSSLGGSVGAQITIVKLSN
ncbi:TPA: hypothetical protein ACGXKU_004573, partial [Bacillus cereus]